MVKHEKLGNKDPSIVGTPEGRTGAPCGSFYLNPGSTSILRVIQNLIDPLAHFRNLSKPRDMCKKRSPPNLYGHWSMLQPPLGSA